MKKLLLPISILLIIFSCAKKTELSISFLDEFVVADSLSFMGSTIGGLSSIDYYNGNYYMVIDDAKEPRFVSAEIDIQNNLISSVNFKTLVKIGDTIHPFFKEYELDLESMFIDSFGEMNFVSEGSILDGKSPSVFKLDSTGKFIHNYNIPEYFIPNRIAKLKHNGAFEGSSKSFDNKGFWVAMESPLIDDGDEPTFVKKSSPVRITYFDADNKKATKQFAYQLDSIGKPKKGRINLNGLTAVLEYEKNKFFIVERTYQSGYGLFGNTVKIYDVSIDEETTNTLSINSLKQTKITAAKKRLVFDFDNVKDKLTDKIVDNIEGITLGPILSNGNQSLILVSDDNFQAYGKQLNQFLLLEIIKK